MAMDESSTDGSGGGLPGGTHWLGVLMALYQRGWPQAAIAVLSFILFNLKPQQKHKHGTTILHKPRRASIFEPLAAFLNVLTLGLFVAARGTDPSALLLAYVCLLQLGRTMASEAHRQTFRHHIDVILVCILVLIGATEGLSLMMIRSNTAVAQTEIRAVASLLASVCVAAFSPHECVTQVEKLHYPPPDPASEEMCSWVDYLFTYSRASALIFGVKGKITVDQLDQLPPAYDPEPMRQRFSEIRKTQPTTTRALLLLLWPQLLLCTTLGVLVAVAKLVSPMGLHQLLEYMQHPEEAIFRPWLWLAVICGGRVTQTSLQQAWGSQSRKLVAQVNAMLTAEVYHSVLASRELQGNFLSTDSSGSKEESQSTASGILENLVASDVRNITQLHDVLIVVTAIPAAVTAVLALYRLVGWPCLIGIILALSGSPFETWIMDYIGSEEELAKTAEDLRISRASEYLRSIKIIKYFAWEESAAKNIAQARATEEKHIKKIDIFSTGLSLIADFFPILSLVAIFGLHVRTMALTASTAYTTIQLLEIVKDCLVFLALMSVDYSRAMVSLRRFDRFFKSLTPLDTYPEGPVEIQDAIFQRAAGADFHLRDISVKFHENGLNVVTGDSGSGKSSLLLALLGETFKKSGSVTRQKDTAYASQTPWLQTGKIQDNIVFYNSYDEKRYRKVIDACCLDVDFAEMQHGDQTVIGDGGFALSGGQRARVALARALFSDASLLLLDDIFSALDTRTTLELWNGVFCSDLLKNRTVILVTQHAWVTDEANLSVVMENGRIQSVRENKAHVRKSKAVQSDANGKVELAAQFQVPLEVNEEDMETDDDTALIASSEPAASAASSLSVFTYLMYFGGPIIAILTVSTCFLHTGARIGTNYWMSRWVEHANDGGSNTMYYLLTYIGLSYLSQAIDFLRIMTFTRGIWAASSRLHTEMISSVLAAPLSWFTEQAISETLNRLSGDMATLDQSIFNSLVPAISDIIQCCLMMGTIATKLPVFIVPAVILLIISGLVSRMYEGASGLLSDLVSSSRSPVLSDFSEGLAGSMIIRATSSTPATFHTKMNHLLCVSSRAQLAQSNANQWLKFRMGILATAINVLAAWLALSQTGIMSAGFVGFCLSQATQLSDKVLALIYSFNRLSLDMQTFQRVRDYTKLVPEKERSSKNSAEVPASWPSTGAIELRNVTVRYTPHGQDILKNISLRIEPGERIAIVGRTGSGKSTLILSLLGFTEVESGQILYDGMDLASIPRRRLRQCISTIPQEAQLFQGTLASNLDPSGTVPEAELQKALDVCQRILRSVGEAEVEKSATDDATDKGSFTERLTLSTIVNAKGENFSHGQRQVLSLCRVLVRQSKLVLLDEATSSMDARTDAGVQAALREELSGEGGEKRALVTVAHRLQTIMDYDKVVVMGSGRILEVGGPKELLAKKGTFYDMVMHSGEKGIADEEI